MKKILFSILVAIIALPLFTVKASSPIYLGPPVKINQNLILNNSFEKPGINNSRAYGWHNFQNGYQRVKIAHTGSWGIKLKNKTTDDIAGAYQKITLNQTEIKPVFIGAYVMGRNIKMKTNGWFGAGIYAEIHLNDGQIVYWNSIANSGSFNWRWIGFNTGTLKGVNKPISYIFVVPILADAKGTAYFDDITVKEFNKKQGAVTIMFDDAEISAYTIAKPILNQYGFKASTPTIVEMVGENGYMNTTQLKNLQNQGWEIISHGTTHHDMTKISLWQAYWEMLLSKIQLENWGLKIKNMALPYGAYNGNLLGKGQGIYRSIRAYELGDNPQGVFPYDVKVRSVVNNTSVQQISDWVKEAKNNKRWEVIVFHSITQNGDDIYHTDPKIFSQMIKTISDSGIKVVTYDQGLDIFASKK